ncbi:MAG: hypothetical protein Q4F41_12195 [Eubacteriales bacterium]|nr:hypothetical protein [Eubacteriales bacterium]
MNKKRFLCIGMAVCMLGLTGCQKSAETPKETAGGETNQVSETNAKSSFKPPAGSRIDGNGNFVDREGNTYNQEGGWEVPEGGRMDSSGRIYDKDGNLMYGGAVAGSQG